MAAVHLEGCMVVLLYQFYLMPFQCTVEIQRHGLVLFIGFHTEVQRQDIRIVSVIQSQPAHITAGNDIQNLFKVLNFSVSSSHVCLV